MLSQVCSEECSRRIQVSRQDEIGGLVNDNAFLVSELTSQRPQTLSRELA